MKKEIEKLLDGSRTAYSIGKAVGLAPNIVQYYIDGERKIENMSLKNAEKLYEYYLMVAQEKEL